MAETKLLPKIGSKVKININKVKDRLPTKLIDQIASISLSKKSLIVWV